ncbi:2-dehydropantoate 2-reductase [Nocardia sp. CNY236]|uniref:2-dehydropantoate 2-reductase n=1 Tax=Nocardia sp. CNY236 TaxID=1169152 RepID=UPI00041C3059|nr:2-dehydropantoate 2-reductase [Nocardia sp. CNY236]
MSVRVLVLGAGSVGSFVGGKLGVAGADVTLAGRRWVLDELAASGLRLSDLDGGDDVLAADQVRLAAEPADIGPIDIVLVTVKAAATATAVREFASVIQPGTVVLSLQNGIGNDSVIRENLPRCVVLAGIVLFNVAHYPGGHFHRGTAGGLAVQEDPGLAPYLDVFERAGLRLRRYRDLRPMQWAKLLINLNNPVNALSGRSLREELGDRNYRRCFALAQREALTVMNRARIRPARLTALPPRLIATMLGSPDALFRRLSGRVFAIDPMARTSMAEDLDLGRTTEIAWLCGEIVELGAMVGMPTPVNQRLIELIVAAERGDRRHWSGVELLDQLRAAASGGSAGGRVNGR